jgi:hypothetical protein
MNKEKQKQLIVEIMDEDAKDGLYAREHNSPIIQELIDETTPEELEKINKEMKQTAVEWLFDRLQSEPFLTHEDFKQAKEMEKQQIIDARIDGDENYTLVGNKREEYAEQYYNETFGGL